MAKIISMPDDLLAETAALAKRRRTNHSALIAAAGRRELRRPVPARVIAAMERSQKRFADAGSFESADLIRGERDSH